MSVSRMLSLAAIAASVTLISCATPGSGSPTALPTAGPTVSPAATPPVTAEPAISITSPTSGETVSVPFTVMGDANTFEAEVTVDVVDQSGLQNCVRGVTATSGSGTPGTFEAVLAFPPEVDPLPVVLRAYSHSAKDGSIVDLVEVPITVATERPPIILATPTCGQVVPPGGLILVTGTAAVFEAALNVEVRNASGVAVVELPVMAEECCVESPFSARLTLPADLPPGRFDVVAFELSAKDGSVQHEFPVQIEVRG
ncbi:Gmad2 immunoglobulin-like domain-containing protein [Agromyces sp. NPDC056523]|uniref:Gmad2 immunoglobulin-like domain-containing protein n=1 Tax=Agromyces sp. NPDC056523 TaxID=3345850 RepID=UPI00366DF563